MGLCEPVYDIIETGVPADYSGIEATSKF